MRIEIPELSLVVLIGASGSGKTTFAKQYFKSTEILSSDYFRALISDDENNQQVTPQAFQTLYYVANKRLDLGLLTVIDATNVQKEARTGILQLAKEQNCHAVAIVFDLPEKVCKEHNKVRSDRTVDSHVIVRQQEQLRRSLKHLQKEGFRYVYVLKSEEDMNQVEIIRKPLWSNKKEETGPFDIIGDIHGCYDELCELLEKLEYSVDKEQCTAYPVQIEDISKIDETSKIEDISKTEDASHINKTSKREDASNLEHRDISSTGRKVVFLGDLCDRGLKNVKVLRLVMNMVNSGNALCVAGNHDVKLLKYLRGSNVKLSHGLENTVNELTEQDEDFISEVKEFLDGRISHYVLNNGKLVVAHAGLKEAYHGRGSGRVRNFCLYGDTTGETDEYGLPVRLPWANEYRGKAMVVYGHTPTPSVEVINNTFCIDTGCVFGGKLTCFRYPEKEIVDVKAMEEYYAPVKPFIEKPLEQDDILKIDDVLGKKYLTTRLRHGIKIREENTITALEVMSRFAADPHWLIYLPPTMSPCETSKECNYLEYPKEAFEYYRKNGINQVVCEQKHMGSRAVIVLCKSEAVAIRRFQVQEGFGIIYTRTGRHFFEQDDTETLLLQRLQVVLEKNGFWDDYQTDWVCLDTELMPWSAKAQKLLEGQYAPTGCAGRNSLKAVNEVLQKAVKQLSLNVANKDQKKQDVDLNELLKKYQEKEEALVHYTKAYRQYCWDVYGIEDYKIAPFHILATEGRTWCEENHLWHMEQIAKYIAGDPIFMATNHILVNLLDDESIEQAVKWWEELTSSGGEGMVVKPFNFIAQKGTELLQPAVKCRGREYLRIIYGAEYLLGENLNRLKKRSLSKKRNLALNEFALGMEALERFVQKEPLYRVHECVFGVLAMESEPVDPRL